MPVTVNLSNIDPDGPTFAELVAQQVADLPDDHPIKVRAPAAVTDADRAIRAEYNRAARESFNRIRSTVDHADA